MVSLPSSQAKMHGLLQFILGIIWASFFSEYALHRFVFHSSWLHRLLRWSPPVQEHIRHHREPFFAPWWIKLLAVVPALLIVPYFVIGGYFGIALTIYYVALEAAHWMMHMTKPSTALGLWFRRYHFHHHFISPNRNFGFVAGASYDYLFNTNSEKFNDASIISIPDYYEIPWLHDGVQIEAEFTQYFLLKKTTKKTTKTTLDGSKL